MNFDESPLLVIWEVTQACDLACVHCRASAVPNRHPLELTTNEGFDLLREIKFFGNPLMVFTGGDPLKRPDLYKMIEYSVDLGLRTNVTPSATPLLTTGVVDRFKELGVSRLALSIDGPDAPTHDAFRGVPGTFEAFMRAALRAKAIGLDTQIQTTVTKRNKHLLPEMRDLVARIGGRMWSLFFLTIIGRAAAEDDLTGEEYEQVFEFLYETSKTAPFEVKTTEAMHYRRFIAQRQREEHGVHADTEGARRMAFRTAGVSDGRGFVFVSHTGEIYPSGFLPLTAGNVRRDSLVDVYRNSTLFRELRDPTMREGKCGLCEYVKICGGSRSRAYSCTGDHLAEDPRCIYMPVLNNHVTRNHDHLEAISAACGGLLS
ncbi:MAG: TIGR04053 family radical SAM/SPASM domain-containing protein [Bryobacteraceae bacterium]